MRKWGVNSKYRQHREHTAAKKSRQGQTGRYLKGQLDLQVNRRKVSAQRRLQAAQRKRLRDAQAETGRAEQSQGTSRTGARLDHNSALHYRDKTDHTYIGTKYIVLHASVFPAGY